MNQKYENQHYRDTFKVGTKFIGICEDKDLSDITWEVVDIYYYSDECKSPLFSLMIVDDKTRNEREQELIKDKKNNQHCKFIQKLTLDEYCTITNIQPLWFDYREIVLQ